MFLIKILGHLSWHPYVQLCMHVLSRDMQSVDAD